MSIMNIVEVFGAMVAALGGYEGLKWVVRRFFPAKTEKRQDEAEVRKLEVDTEKAIRDMYEESMKEMREEFVERIKELRESNIQLNAQNTELIKAGARKDEIISDKTVKIRELEEIRINDAKTIGKLEKLVLFYRSWHCEREFGNGTEHCRRRRPAQNPHLKYLPIDGNYSIDNPNDCEQ